MNPKTEDRISNAPRQESEFSPTFVGWLVTLTVATLFLVFVVGAFYRTVNPLKLWIGPFPWVNAAGLTIESGLAAFSGATPEPITTQMRYGVLASLLTVLVVGPTLFLFGWRRRRLSQEAAPEPSSRVLTAILFILGGTLMFIIVVPAVPAAIIQRMVSTSMRKAQAVATNKDVMIGELNLVKSKAFEYRILPASFGGGIGSYEGFRIPADLASTQDATFEIVNCSRDTIIVKAFSKLYAGATVRVSLNEKGLWSSGYWIYEGQFK